MYMSVRHAAKAMVLSSGFEKRRPVMTKFTQGEWTYDPKNGIVHNDGKLIAEVAGAGGSNYRHERGETNARLIAAAPKMYRLLKAVANYKPDFVWDVVFNAQELLARIDGEEAKYE